MAQHDSGSARPGSGEPQSQRAHGPSQQGDSGRDRGEGGDRGGISDHVADNDYGNLGITESGNFGNYDAQGRTNPPSKETSAAANAPKGQGKPHEDRP